jgi:hypothetical protein
MKRLVYIVLIAVLAMLIYVAMTLALLQPTVARGSGLTVMSQQAPARATPSASVATIFVTQ